ncbi:MAG: methyltransferase domain-containing protein [Candidatus Niyogibacteria bacterium]|nr:MAG: methyltransferase domain-containing protein [Candidatus Niyogibacteria bacterium]
MESVYNDGYFNVANWEYALGISPKIFAETIVNLYGVRSVADIGCGPGFYSREFGKLGVDYFGADGSPAALRNLIIDKRNFILRDLTEKFNLSRKYDCAICLEVAEHIPADKSEILVENLSKISDLIFFTAARPGQGGHDHINEQSPQFWVNIFNNFDFEFQLDDTNRIKKILADNNVVFWIKDNLLVFRRRK